MNDVSPRASMDNFSPPDPAGTQMLKDRFWAFAQQSLDHAILLIGTDHYVTWASPGAARILGADAATIEGCSHERFFTPEDIAIGIPQQEFVVASSRTSAEDDRWMMRADGSRFWAAGLMVALRDAEGGLIGFVKILRDLTDLKMQMETLRNRAIELSAADAAKGRSIATLAHELRNPLSALSMATVVLREVSHGDARLQVPLEILERNVGFAARLVEDLEGAIRAVAGKLELEPEPLLLREVLDASIRIVLDRAGTPSRRIELLLPEASIAFEADRLRIQQVLVNLIGNAVKFTPDDGRIWIKGTVEGIRVVVRVEDCGVGIAPDMLERIFEIFTQGETPSVPTGLGIGLSVVKEIVELHGGSVQARSEGVGKGSKFTVRLPLHQKDSRMPLQN